jgi:hypothetical protein
MHSVEISGGDKGGEVLSTGNVDVNGEVQKQIDAVHVGSSDHGCLETASELSPCSMYARACVYKLLQIEEIVDGSSGSGRVPKKSSLHRGHGAMVEKSLDNSIVPRILCSSQQSVTMFSAFQGYVSAVF